MNLDPINWWMFTARLALEASLLAIAAAGACRLTRAASGRRWIWQSALLATAILWSAELLDLRHLASTSPPAKPTAAVEFQVRTGETLEPSQGAASAGGAVTSPPVAGDLYRRFTESSSPSVQWPGWLWLTGTAVTLSAVLLARLRLHRWARRQPSIDSTAVPCREESATQASAFGLRRVRLLSSTDLAGPVAFGVLRPTIALPANAPERFSPPQRQAMLAHELAHLAQRDPAWNLIADLLVAIAWWHPLVWWMRRQFQTAAEEAADEAAARIPGGPVALAEALVALGRELTRTAPSPGYGVVGNGFRSHLARRVTALLNTSRSPAAWQPPNPAFRWLARGCFLLSTTLLLAVPWPASASLGLLAFFQPTAPPAATNPSAEALGTNVATLTSILNDPQFRQVVTALKEAPPIPATTPPAAPHPATSSTNTPAQPILIEVKFAEIQERSSDDLGLDWLFGQSPTNNATLQQVGPDTLPAFTGSPQGEGLRVDLFRLEEQSAALNPTQLAALMARLESRGGFEIKAAPRVTTLPGRAAAVAMLEARTLVTSVDVTAPTNTTDTGSVNYLSEQLQVGPSVEILPVLENDLIRLKITASVTEFVGYDDPRDTDRPPKRGVEETRVDHQSPLPRVRVRQIIADGTTGARIAAARPGETVVLRGPQITEVLHTVDKVAVLGDLPLLGRLFRNQSTTTVQKRLYLFIRPTVASE